MNSHRQETFTTLSRLGFNTAETKALIRYSGWLHAWAEHECNGAIQRDEHTGVPFWHSTIDGRKLAIANDREQSALRLAAKIAAAHGMLIYHQTDPRGCALYLYTAAELAQYMLRSSVDGIESCYNSVGTAVVT